MTLKDMIPLRKSVRSYRPDPIDEATLTQIRGYIADLKPLYPGARVEARIIRTEQAHFLQPWKTPHFLAIFCEEKEGALENVGFMFQQLDLYLQSIGLGTCWVGLGWLNDEEPVPEGMKLAVMMAMGHPEENARRSGPADFKRRSTAEIADAPDPRLEAVRLAPSATNSQPWYFTHEGDTVHVFRETLGRLKQRTHGRMNRIDMGIALAHLYVENPESFTFFEAESAPEAEGYTYIGSVRL